MMNSKKNEINWENVIVGSTIIFFALMSSFFFMGRRTPDHLMLEKAVEEQDYDTVKTIVDYCSVFESKLDQISCVNEYFKEVFTYDGNYLKQIISVRILSPEDGFLGECESSSTFYARIFDELGIENELILEPQHIYNKVWFTDEYGQDWECEVDIFRYSCDTIQYP